MARIVTMTKDPVFESVTGLTNRTFVPSNIRSGQMATEDQLMALENRATALQRRINECCRDLCIWKTYLRIVEERTGIIVSDFFDNMKVEHTRRGVPFTVEFAREFDESKFIMDRSGSDRVEAQYKNFKIVTTGMNTNHRANTKQIEDRLASMLNDYYENSSVRGGVTYQYWPFPPGGDSVNPSVILNATNSTIAYRFLPQTVRVRDNLYHVYKDSADNKIKIDILGKNQFEYDITSSSPVKGYDTIFVTQWVLKEGASL